MQVTTHWAARITKAWGEAVAGVVRTGQLLLDAKADLEHGEFAHMVKRELPFGMRAAEILMSIAKHPELRNANHGSRLPASWRTLGELARLSPESFRAALDEGKIHPEMERKDAVALRRQSPARPRLVSAKVQKDTAVYSFDLSASKRARLDSLMPLLRFARQYPDFWHDVVTCDRDLARQALHDLAAALGVDNKDVDAA